MTVEEGLAEAAFVVSPAGPCTPFELLFDDAHGGTCELPATFRTIYPGSWTLPPSGPRPYVCVNFVLSRDGRVSFNEPGHMSGGEVSGFSAHDRWLMALLRATSRRDPHGRHHTAGRARARLGRGAHLPG